MPPQPTITHVLCDVYGPLRHRQFGLRVGVAAASSALIVGAAIGTRDPPRKVTGVLLAFASGALVSALAN